MKRKRQTGIFILVITLIFCGCSRETSYRYLSVFFEGVPDPNQKVTTQSDSTGRLDDSLRLKEMPVTAQKSKYNFHPPYKERTCENCHNATDRTKFVEILPTLCYNCHENFGNKFTSLHGPVSGGFCTACHNPHKSENEKLLTRTGQDLCIQCHGMTQVKKNEVHADIGDMICTECHNPHGGTDKYMLK